MTEYFRAPDKIELSITISGGSGNATTVRPLNGILNRLTIKGPNGASLEFILEDDKGYVYITGFGERANRYSRPETLPLDGFYTVRVSNATIDGIYTFLFTII